MDKISELKVGQGNVNVQGTVRDISDTRAFNKYGRDLKVANAFLEDESGSIKISLWNDDITRIKNGDKIKLTNGYVSEFNSEKQLSAGKMGKIEIVS
jgi:replication factor A1